MRETARPRRRWKWYTGAEKQTPDTRLVPTYTPIAHSTSDTAGLTEPDVRYPAAMRNMSTCDNEAMIPPSIRQTDGPHAAPTRATTGGVTKPSANGSVLTLASWASDRPSAACMAPAYTPKPYDEPVVHAEYMHAMNASRGAVVESKPNIIAAEPKAVESEVVHETTIALSPPLLRPP
eukprot:scaffold33163_cov90-Isochrysis_galbana.AAC.1